MPKYPTNGTNHQLTSFFTLKISTTFMARFSRFRRRFRGVSFGVKKKLRSARRTASNHRKKAKTLTTILMLGGAYLAYDKFIKK